MTRVTWHRILFNVQLCTWKIVTSSSVWSIPQKYLVLLRIQAFRGGSKHNVNSFLEKLIRAINSRTNLCRLLLITFIMCGFWSETWKKRTWPSLIKLLFQTKLFSSRIPFHVHSLAKNTTLYNSKNINDTVPALNCDKYSTMLDCWSSSWPLFNSYS